MWLFFFLMARRPPRPTPIKSSAASDVYQRQIPTGAAVPEEKPNAETIASIEELENGGGTLFTGSTEALFAELMEE